MDKRVINEEMVNAFNERLDNLRIEIIGFIRDTLKEEEKKNLFIVSEEEINFEEETLTESGVHTAVHDCPLVSVVREIGDVVSAYVVGLEYEETPEQREPYVINVYYYRYQWNYAHEITKTPLENVISNYIPELLDVIKSGNPINLK